MLKKSDNSKVLLIAAGGKGTEIDLEDIEFKNKPYKYNSDQPKILSKFSDFLFYILGNTPKEYAEKIVKILELNIRNGKTIWDYSLKISGLKNENIN